LSQLIEGKKIAYGWLGVQVQDMTEDLAKYFNLQDVKGVLVAKVLKDGPSDKGGLKDGDIITSFNGQAISDVKTLLNMVGRIDVGKKVAVAVLRSNKPVSLNIEIGSRPEAAVSGKSPEQESDGGLPAADWRGLKVQDITRENIERFDLEDSSGVVVVSVEPRSPADTAGIMPGDVIQEINRMTVGNLADYQKIIKGVQGDALVGVSRGYVILKSK
ncbi:MAG: PDZ domain-containing protein, partial [Candidatus Omnitrophica bacterium]|nr:PDZ domain-containing protein [Candidatus Omnitrophota bacterium]